jgi:outer membrane lipoprotein carrier protein
MIRSGLHERRRRSVYFYVTRLAAGLALPLFLLAASDARLDSILHNVESHYNKVQSLKLDFTETYTASRRPTQVERGVLFLRKPGKMRWDYAAPEGKVFLSDGKNVLFYTPGNHRLVKSKLKESEDLRAPLAFLLGKLNFAKEFHDFTSRPEGQDLWVTAQPNNDAAYTQVEFLVAPDSTIRRLKITALDRSLLDFTFANEQFNAPVTASMFTFTPPPGTELVDEEKNQPEAHR